MKNITLDVDWEAESKLITLKIGRLFNSKLAYLTTSFIYSASQLLGWDYIVWQAVGRELESSKMKMLWILIEFAVN